MQLPSSVVLVSPGLQSHQNRTEIGQLLERLDKLSATAKDLISNPYGKERVLTFLTGLKQLEVFLLKTQFPGDREIRDQLRQELDLLERIQNSPSRFQPP